MEDKPVSKPPFWSSLPGIFTALGGVLVALTGLITALYSSGAIGAKTNSNVAAPTNAAVTQVAVPTASPPPISENDRYKLLTGKWEVTEEPGQEPPGSKKVTWLYDGTVSGNVLTLTGKISAIDDNKNLSTDQEGIRSTYITTLMGLAGTGEFRIKKSAQGGTMMNPATIRLELDGDRPTLHGTIEIKGQVACSLTGKKL